MSEAERLDAAAKALREYEMAGKITREWADIPKSQKRKWWAKAKIALDAAAAYHPVFECPGCGRDIAEPNSMCAPNCPRDEITA